MEINGTSAQVLLRDVQYHPFKQLVLHIDFQRVDANTKMHKKVPIHYSGEDASPAVKADACLINHVITELEVSCLPADLPEFIAVDLSNLRKGSSLHMARPTRFWCRSWLLLQKPKPQHLPPKPRNNSGWFRKPYGPLRWAVCFGATDNHAP
jgi:hypothetical protein